MTGGAAEAAVKAWLESAVIGLNLCPFAAPVVRQKRLRIVVREDRTASGVLGAMIDEMLALAEPDASHHTTLIVAAGALQDFDEFLDVVAQTDGMIDQIGLRGRLPMAHFHPEYRFAELPAGDHGHWTNRAPYPILHLLREQDVSEAVARYPDAAGIPARNVARLQAMSLTAIQAAIRGKP